MKNNQRKGASPKGDSPKLEYLLSHALARIKIASLLGVRPKKLPLIFKPGMKPQLGSSKNNKGYVSISHTEGMVACAFGPYPVGIDVQKRGKGKNIQKMAHRFFSAGETESLLKLKGIKKINHFDLLWVLKEALYKAADYSFEEVFQKSEFMFTKRGEVLLKSNDKWRFRLFYPTPRHIMALAVDILEPFNVDYRRVLLGNI